jgi:C4-dicarboxylate transporter DctM subunit
VVGGGAVGVVRAEDDLGDRDQLGQRVSTATIFSGVLPFMWADVVRLILLVAFPWLSLWLPSLMR